MSVSPLSPDRVEAATAALKREETANGLLRRTADELGTLLDAPACLISRVIGDLLLEIAQSSAGSLPDPTGHGYLLSDYPLTQEVIEACETRSVSLLDKDPEPNEAALLKELRYDSLLMVPLPALGECWGLVEIYANGRHFTNEEARLAEQLAVRAGQLLEELQEYRSD